MRRIGIMGGTFNPIHNGHLAVAERAREQFLLEKVMFLPSGVPYMKNLREVLPVSVRCEMTSLAIADIPYFELSEMEASDAETRKNTYTFETLEKLRQLDPEAQYYFILGADSLQTIEHWKNPRLIFQDCIILAAVRWEKGSSEENAKKLLDRQILYLQEKFGAVIEILKFQGIDISSTKLREKIQMGESVHNLMPEAVENYILTHHLYEKSTD